MNFWGNFLHNDMRAQLNSRCRYQGVHLQLLGALWCHRIACSRPESSWMHESRACLSKARYSHGRPKDLPKRSRSRWIHVAANLFCPRSEIICIMQSGNCSSTQRTRTLTPVCALHLIQTARLPGMRYRLRITRLIGCRGPHQTLLLPLFVRQRFAWLAAAYAHQARLPVWTCRNPRVTKSIVRLEVRPIALVQLLSFCFVAELVNGTGGCSEASCQCSLLPRLSFPSNQDP
jgi:hypothetical protein